MRLNVIRQGKKLPVCFFSRQLRGAERNYLATEIESLGVVEAMEHWTHFRYSQTFNIVTDHKVLCHLMTSQHLNKRLRRFALHLSLYYFTVRYRPGRASTNADGLSRQAWETIEETDCSLSLTFLPNRRLKFEEGDVGTEQMENPKSGRMRLNRTKKKERDLLDASISC